MKGIVLQLLEAVVAVTIDHSTCMPRGDASCRLVVRFAARQAA